MTADCGAGSALGEMRGFGGCLALVMPVCYNLAMISGSPTSAPLPALTPMHILWDNRQGTAALWRITAGGKTQRQFGPFAGWSARTLALGPDGAAHLLWTGRGGTASVWSVAEDGETRHSEFGPFAGWEAASLAVGPDGAQHVLWNRGDGAAILWTIQPEQAPAVRTFGPYDGWRATSLSIGSDNHLHLLWNCRDGQASVWRWAGGGLEDDGEIESQATYGPYDGWTAAAIAGDSVGASRLLWRGEGGQASLWTLDDAAEADEQTRTVYGPFEGWTASAAACGPDGGAHLLWRYDLGGLASLWRVAADGEVTHEEHGPYTDWVPVALATGP